MKSYIFAGVVGINLLACVPAVAMTCSMEFCDDSGQLPFMPGCMSAQNLGCLHGLVINTCNKCRSGYTMKEQTTYDSTYGCNYQQTVCEQACTGCSNCTSDTTWSAGNTGYEKKATRTCNCNTCSTSWQYRCASGYYGSSTNGTSGCTRCPSSGGVYGNSAAGSTAITSCYLPSGTTGSDSTGSFTYTSNCYYAN